MILSDVLHLIIILQLLMLFPRLVKRNKDLVATDVLSEVKLTRLHKTYKL